MSSCAICLEPELMVPAACVPCGHTFCLACITQWTKTPALFSLSLPLCPQCRVPVREVQKLFISDWPASSGSGVGGGVGWAPPYAELTTWQQFRQLVALLLHFLCLPVHAAARYGPELAQRGAVWLNHQAERLVALRARLRHCAVACLREWQDLGRQGQCLVGAALLLLLLLLLQDLQQPDGIHRGIVLPVFILLLDILHQVTFLVGYLFFRPLACVVTCGAEIAVAALDVVCALLSCVAMVFWDVLCVPWLVLGVGARAIGWVLSLVVGALRVCLLVLVLAVSVAVPVYLSTSPEERGAFPFPPECVRAWAEWAGRFLVRRSARQPPRQRHGGQRQGQLPEQGQEQQEQQANRSNQQQQGQHANQNNRQQQLRLHFEAEAAFHYSNFLHEFLRFLTEKLEDLVREGGEGEEGGESEGEGRGERVREGVRTVVEGLRRRLGDNDDDDDDDENEVVSMSRSSAEVM